MACIGLDSFQRGWDKLKEHSGSINYLVMVAKWNLPIQKRCLVESQLQGKGHWRQGTDDYVQETYPCQFFPFSNRIRIVIGTCPISCSLYSTVHTDVIMMQGPFIACSGWLLWEMGCWISYIRPLVVCL